MGEVSDVLIVGAGHAGVEAALAASRLGCKVTVITTNTDRISFMSCNPAIGGLAKGHIVREIDVLGGEMGYQADNVCIQFRRLNASKGPAVRGSRAQCDKALYSQNMKKALCSHSNIHLLKAEVSSLIIKDNICRGVILKDNSYIFSKTVVITTGTFMNGVMHTGTHKQMGGRVGERATVGLSSQLADIGFSVHRLKTGTPARLDAKSINWSLTEEQLGDKVFYPFSYRSSDIPKLPQVSCYLTYTSDETHEIIRKNIHKSPIYNGIIESIGPRYCPSIEDKVMRFPDKHRHQTFLEPEGLNTNSIYLQGISTSLPKETQDSFLKTIAGLKNVKVLQYGYAVEYDFVEPCQIKHTLETRLIPNLFLAGQVNGTSGYEEAAGQGLIAGANAALKIKDQNEFLLERDQAYIGVLIDDLITKGTKEPYRMFTSRAEFRMNLREDNTLERLLEKSYKFKLLPQKDFDHLNRILESRKQHYKLLDQTKLTPKRQIREKFEELRIPFVQKPLSFKDLLRRNDISYKDLKHFGFPTIGDRKVTEAVEIAIKYEGYISRQQELIDQAKKLENLPLENEFPYDKIKGLSREEVEKLQRVRPRTLGQASRISGVNPSAIQALMIYKKARANQNPKASYS